MTERGQASVEVVALLPLAVVVVLAAFHLLASGQAAEAARAASQAGAMAILQDADPRAAAREALGGAARRATVRVSGRRVTVRVRPRGVLPPLRPLLAARERADAGPGPAVPASSGAALRGGDGDSARPAGRGR